MSNRQINTGILSYGMSGKVFHAPFVHAHEGFNFVAIVERSKKIAQSDYPYIKSYDSVDDLLADESIELVIVNTPNNTHYDYAKQALQAGKHILVEKPFAATVEQSKELFALADRVEKKALVYQNRRYDSGFNSTKQVIESGKLGKLIEVHFRYDRYRAEIGPKKFKEEAFPASGLSYDLGPHLLDQAISLFGKPERFYKTLGKNRVDTVVDDYFHIQLNYANDLNVFLTASLLVADIPPAFVLNGSTGSFWKNHSDVQEKQLLGGGKPTDANFGVENPEDKGKLTVVNADGTFTSIFVESPKGNYMQIFESVYQSIANDVPYPIKQEEVIWQLEILEA